MKLSNIVLIFYLNWFYKILTANPIRRFCVPGRTSSDTANYYGDQVDREVKYARERGEVIPAKQRDEMLSKELKREVNSAAKTLLPHFNI